MCMISYSGLANTLKMQVMRSEEGEIRKITILSTSLAGERV